MLGHTRTAAINNIHNISETIEAISTLQQATKTFHYSNIWNCDKWLHRHKFLFRNIEAQEPWRDIKTQVKDSKTSQSFWCPSLARQKLQQNTKPPALLTIIKSGNTVYVLIPIYYEGVDCGLESTLHCFTINFFTCISKYFLSFIIICFIYSFSKLLFLFAFKTPMFSKRFTKNIYYEWSKNKTTV